MDRITKKLITEIYARNNLDWTPVTFTVLGVVFSTDVLEIVTICFENKLNEMKKVLNAWSRRNLPSLGGEQ